MSPSTQPPVRAVARTLLLAALALAGASLACGDSAGPAPNPAPAATALTPDTVEQGAAGFTLAVTGRGFVPTSRVRWNGAERPTTFVSATELHASASGADVATAGTASITVWSPAPGGGVSNALELIVRVPPNPVARLTGLDPDTVVAGSGAFTLVVHGTDFLPSSKVRWNDAERPTTFVSATELSASLTAADVAAAGAGSLTVANPAPGGGVSDPLALIIIEPPNPMPQLTALDPDTVVVGSGAFTLLVHGGSFLPTSRVRWNGAERSTTFVSATELSASITAADVAAAGTGTVTVANPAPGGGVSEALGLTIRAPLPGRLELTADSVELLIGDTLWVGATVRDSLGVPVPTAQVTWTRQDNSTEFQVRSGGSEARVRVREIGVGRIVATSGALADTLVLRVRPIDAVLASVAIGAVSCGRDTSRRTYCWGFHYIGRAVNGGSFGSWTFAPAPLGGAATFDTVVVGNAHACGLVAGEAFCWYGDTRGSLGTGGATFGGSAVPLAVAGGHRFASIATQGWHTCGLDAAGQAFCWGANTLAQIGDGSQTDARTPVAVGGTLRFAAIVPGSWHTCALDFDNRAWCWGFNGNGQLGHTSTETCEDPFLGSVPCTRTPKLVETDLHFIRIAVGGRHTCALTPEGAAYCWGDGLRGQLGGGSATTTASPTPVAGGTVYTAIGAGIVHTCALTTRGTAECWGANEYGAVGEPPGRSPVCIENNNAYPCRTSPLPLAWDQPFVTLNVGGYQNCGITSTGLAGVYCWGDNMDGGLGAGSASPWSSSVPLPVYDGRFAAPRH